MCIQTRRRALSFVNWMAALLVLVLLSAAVVRAATTPGVPADRPLSSRQAALPPGYLADIQGATYDQATGELILFGSDDSSLPAFDEDNLTVALRTRFDFTADTQDLWPGVTIEFSPTNQSVLDVFYFGQVRNTRFGYVVFEADRLLKYYGLGYDNGSGTPVPITSSVPGYKSELQCLSEQNFIPTGPTIQWRKWFSPTLMIERAADDSAIAFAQARVTLNWAYDSAATNPAVDQCVQAFVDHFNVHYEEFADEQQARGNPVLHELNQLARLSAITEWLWEREPDTRIVGMNRPWLNQLPVPSHTTPSTTPRINVSAGQVGQSGGVVLYTPPGSFVPDSGRAANLGRAARTSRPPGQQGWSCTGARSSDDPAPQQGQCSAAAFSNVSSLDSTSTGVDTVDCPGGKCLPDDTSALYVETNLPTASAITVHYWTGKSEALGSTRVRSQLPPRFVRGRYSPAPLGRAAPPGPAADDTLTVHLIPAQGPPVLLQTFTGVGQEGYWVPALGFDLAPYAGKSVTLRFEAQIAPGSPTIFLVGAIEFNATRSLAPPPTITPTATQQPSRKWRSYLPGVMR